MFSLNMLDSSLFSLLLSTCAEQVEGVILSHFYSLSFLVGGLLHADLLGVGWVVLVGGP